MDLLYWIAVLFLGWKGNSVAPEPQNANFSVVGRVVVFYYTAEPEGRTAVTM